MNKQLHIVIGMIINSSVDFPHIPTIFFHCLPLLFVIAGQSCCVKAASAHRAKLAAVPTDEPMHHEGGNQWVGGREYLQETVVFTITFLGFLKQIFH